MRAVGWRRSAPRQRTRTRARIVCTASEGGSREALDNEQRLIEAIFVDEYAIPSAQSAERD